MLTLPFKHSPLSWSSFNMTMTSDTRGIVRIAHLPQPRIVSRGVKPLQAFAAVAHADALRVIVYYGQSHSAGVGSRHSVSTVTPRDLAAVDVCITTYDVLRRDLNHRPDDDAVEHALRGRKLYEVVAAASSTSVRTF